MINVTKQPPAIESFFDEPVQPVPLSDCVEFCLKPDAADVFAVTGSKAKVVFTIPASCSIPADGTPFAVWGHDFTVDSATPFSGDSFQVSAIGIVTFLNLANMFQANIFFRRAVVLAGAVVGSDFELTVTWRECREQPSFAGSNMDLAVFATIGGGAVATNGVSPEYIEAYRLLIHGVRWIDETSEFFQLSPFAGLDVEKLCDEIGEVCVELNADIGADLYTMLPALTGTSFISSIDNGHSMMRYYSAEYGWTYRTDCVPKSGTIVRSDKVLMLNASFDIDDPYQMRRYWYAHPDGFPPSQLVVDFLTRQPKAIPLCQNSFKWLWFLNDWQEEFGNYNLHALWAVYYPDGSFRSNHTSPVNLYASMGHAPHQPVCFNASPAFIAATFSIPMDEIGSYEVNCIGTNVSDIEDVYFNATEILRFDVTHCCEDTTDLYFLSPASGIDTVVVKMDSVEVLESGGREIQIQIGCDASRQDRATNGGRTLVATRVYQKIKMSLQPPRNAAWSKWMKDLRQAPSRWIKIIDEGGFPIAKKIVFENGGIEITKSGEGTTVELVGYLQDIPTQSGTEKFIL